MDTESQFEAELDNLRSESETAIQALFAWLAINHVSSRRSLAGLALNRTPLLWITILHSLQCTYVITLGRIFDTTSDHNIFALLKSAARHPEMFTRAALTKRRMRDSKGGKPPVWLPDYVQSAYEPTPADFRRLRHLVEKRRKRYAGAYRDIRHKFFAHKEYIGAEEIKLLFSGATIGGLQDLLLFANSLYQCLWELIWNGRKPILRQQPSSVRRMVAHRKTASTWRARGVQVTISKEARVLLKCLEEWERSNNTSHRIAQPFRVRKR